LCGTPLASRIHPALRTFLSCQSRWLGSGVQLSQRGNMSRAITNSPLLYFCAAVLSRRAFSGVCLQFNISELLNLPDLTRGSPQTGATQLSTSQARRTECRWSTRPGMRQLTAAIPKTSCHVCSDCKVREWSTLSPRDSLSSIFECSFDVVWAPHSLQSSTNNRPCRSRDLGSASFSVTVSIALIVPRLYQLRRNLFPSLKL
jgi:hypothetical protein